MYMYMLNMDQKCSLIHLDWYKTAMLHVHVGTYVVAYVCVQDCEKVHVHVHA